MNPGLSLRRGPREAGFNERKEKSHRRQRKRAKGGGKEMDAVSWPEKRDKRASRVRGPRSRLAPVRRQGESGGGRGRKKVTLLLYQKKER